MRIVSLLLWLASVLAAQSPAVLAALSTGTYFPLDVGDRWVYRIDDRLVTVSYQTWRVDRTAVSGGVTYSVMANEGPGTIYAESWFRADSSGKLYVLGAAGDTLFLDASGQSPSAILQVTLGNIWRRVPNNRFPYHLAHPNIVSWRPVRQEVKQATGCSDPLTLD